MKVINKTNIQLACVMRLISVNPELGSHPNYKKKVHIHSFKSKKLKNLN